MSVLHRAGAPGLHALWPTGRRRAGMALRIVVCAGAILAAGAVTAGLRFAPPPPPLRLPLAGFAPVEAPDADALMQGLSYPLEPVRGGTAPAPALLLASLPGDLGQLDAPRRKALFLRALLPMVLAVNEHLLAKRRHLLRLADTLARGGALPAEDRAWLTRLARRFDLAPAGAGPGAADLALVDRLLLRVDAVPASLALAQAALESGWGTSRFARHGNALFGERVWSRDAGLAPQGGPASRRFAVRRFDRLVDAVAAYAHNLNTHAAYAGFRARRAAQRIAGRLDAAALAGDLGAYSQLGPEYIGRLRAVMRDNGLAGFDRARLAEPQGPGT